MSEEVENEMPAFQRWSMARGSDGARWSVYMDHDDAGEWVKFSQVKQEWLAAALRSQKQTAST